MARDLAEPDDMVLDDDYFVVVDERRTTWFVFDNAILDKYGRRLGPAGIATYCAVVRYVAGGEFPNSATIAALTGLSERAAEDAVKRLLELGLVVEEADGFLITDVP
jgi:hypothetical protein